MIFLCRSSKKFLPLSQNVRLNVCFILTFPIEKMKSCVDVRCNFPRFAACRAARRFPDIWLLEKSIFKLWNVALFNNVYSEAGYYFMILFWAVYWTILFHFSMICFRFPEFLPVSSGFFRLFGFFFGFLLVSSSFSGFFGFLRLFSSVFFFWIHFWDLSLFKAAIQNVDAILNRLLKESVVGKWISGYQMM